MKTTNRNRGLWIALGMFVLLIVALDQLVKYLTVAHIPSGGAVAVLPGVLHLTYVRNTGAAFSILSGSRWLFVVIAVVFFVVLGVMIKKRIVSKPAELWCLAAIAGGALGNVIDRVAKGSVVDMFEVEFMEFAVFNVADIFVTCGVIGLIVFVLIFDRPKKAEEHEADK